MCKAVSLTRTCGPDCDIQRDRDCDIQRERDCDIQRDRDCDIQRDRDCDIQRERDCDSELMFTLISICYTYCDPDDDGHDY